MPRVSGQAYGGRLGVGRKVIPYDVRDEYARLYGRRTQERFKSDPESAQTPRA